MNTKQEAVNDAWALYEESLDLMTVALYRTLEHPHDSVAETVLRNCRDLTHHYLSVAVEAFGALHEENALISEYKKINQEVLAWEAEVRGYGLSEAQEGYYQTALKNRDSAMEALRVLLGITRLVEIVYAEEKTQVSKVPA